MLVLHSYRNQSIDLLCKSINWGLYEATLAFNCLDSNPTKELQENLSHTFVSKGLAVKVAMFAAAGEAVNSAAELSL